MKYIRHQLTSFDGSQISIYFMREDGKAFARLYFHLNPKSSYCVMDNLSVHKSIRRRGEGTRLQKMREALAKRKGFKFMHLWVKRGSWMDAWYRRRGYTLWGVHKTFRGCVWLKKKL